MRGIRIILGLIVIGLAQVSEPPPAPWLRISPTGSFPGGSVEADGYCTEPGPHEVTSPGLVATITFGGQGRVVDTPGDYVATMRCGAVTLTATFMVRPVGYAQVNLYPTEVEPGGELRVSYHGNIGGPTDPGPYPCSPRGPVTSPGFAADIQWTAGGNGGKQYGWGNAGQVPGTYTATHACGDGRTATITFRILGTPPPPVPPTQQKPQVPVRPKGAPQTGGGGPAVPLLW